MIPATIKGGQFWHVDYKDTLTIIEITPDGKQFYAPRQDFTLRDLSEISRWINEVDIAHVEYDNEIQEEYGYQEAYCLTCGSCGIDGCCPPTRCAAVVCRHSRMYLEDYRILQEQWGIMYEFLERLAGDKIDHIDEIVGIADEVLMNVNNLFPNTINDHRDP